MMAKALRDYTVVRIVEEVYKVEATSKKDALEKIGAREDACQVNVVREYAVWNRPFQLPKSYVVLELKFEK